MLSFEYTDDDRDRWASRVTIAIGEATRSVREQMAAALSGGVVPDPGDLYDPAWWDAAMEQHVNGEFYSIGYEAAELFAKENQLEVGEDWLIGMAILIAAGAVLFIGSRSEVIQRRSTDVIADAWDRLATLDAASEVLESLKSGDEAMTVEQVVARAEAKAAERIAKELGVLDGAESGPVSEGIARTISTGASTNLVSAAADAVIEETGAQGYKIWNCLFVNSRDSHMNADGQKVAVSEMFKVGSSEGRYPGDPDLPVEEVVNCLAEGSTVVLPGLRHSMRRWYEGELVHVRFASGGQLSVTPNHPVLRSSGGWDTAQSLQVGDHVVSGRLIGERPGQPDVEGRPAEVSEIHRAAALAGVSKRVALRPPDLHGDGGHAEVEVESPHGLLGGDGDPAGDEQVEEFGLAVADMARLSEGRLRRTPIFQRGHGPEVGGSFPPGVVGGAGQFSASVLPESGVTIPGGCTPAAGFDPGTQQTVADGLAADVETQREGQFTLALDVATDEVVGVDFDPEWSGWVYNFDTGHGWYLTGSGVICRNCNCWLTYEIVEPAVEIPEAIAAGGAVFGGPGSGPRPGHRSPWYDRGSKAKPSVADLFEGTDSERAAKAQQVYGGRFGPFSSVVAKVVLSDGYLPRGSTPARSATVTGMIVDPVNGRPVGHYTRVITKPEGGEPPFAVHSQMGLDTVEQGKGFGTAFNANAEKWYRANGIDRIELAASNFGLVGGSIVWAKAGYDWRRDAPSNPGTMESIAEQLDEKGDAATAARFRGGEPPTPYEFLQSEYGAGILLNEPWSGVKYLTDSNGQALAASAASVSDDRRRFLAEVAAAWDHEDEELAMLVEVDEIPMVDGFGGPGSGPKPAAAVAASAATWLERFEQLDEIARAWDHAGEDIALEGPVDAIAAAAGSGWLTEIETNEDSAVFDVGIGGHPGAVTYREAVDPEWGNHALVMRDDDGWPSGSLVWRPTDGGIEGLFADSLDEMIDMIIYAGQVADELGDHPPDPEVEVEVDDIGYSTFGGPGSGPRPVVPVEVDEIPEPPQVIVSVEARILAVRRAMAHGVFGGPGSGPRPGHKSSWYERGSRRTPLSAPPFPVVVRNGSMISITPEGKAALRASQDDWTDITGFSVDELNGDSFNPAAGGPRQRLKIEAVERVSAIMHDDPEFQEWATAQTTLRDPADQSKVTRSVSEQLASAYIDQWATTAADASPPAHALQRAVQDVFGIEKPAFISESSKGYLDQDAGTQGLGGEAAGEALGESGLERIDTIYARDGPAMRAYWRATHKATQADLRAAGVTEMTLVRGVEEPAQREPVVREIYANPASSWSVSPIEAHTFGGNGNLYFTTVPASRIIALPSSGPGCASEFEVIVMGGEGSAAVASGYDMGGLDV